MICYAKFFQQKSSKFPNIIDNLTSVYKRNCLMFTVIVNHAGFLFNFKHARFISMFIRVTSLVATLTVHRK